MHHSKSLITLTILIFLFTFKSAFSQNAEDIVKYRINIMKAIGGHISVIAANVKGKVDIQEDIKTHSQALHITIKSINIEKNFPPKTSHKEIEKSRALEDIWINKEEFNIAMQNSILAAKNLSDIANAGDKNAVGKALGALGKTCGACHKKFRKEK